VCGLPYWWAFFFEGPPHVPLSTLRSHRVSCQPYFSFEAIPWPAIRCPLVVSMSPSCLLKAGVSPCLSFFVPSFREANPPIDFEVPTRPMRSQSVFHVSEFEFSLRDVIPFVFSGWRCAYRIIALPLANPPHRRAPSDGLSLSFISFFFFEEFLLRLSWRRSAYVRP